MVQEPDARTPTRSSPVALRTVSGSSNGKRTATMRSPPRPKPKDTDERSDTPRVRLDCCGGSALGRFVAFVSLPTAGAFSIGGGCGSFAALRWAGFSSGGGRIPGESGGPTDGWRLLRTFLSTTPEGLP
eukprot:scaffold138548_cov24-Tisochrysis_lutea.AAC.2